MQHIKRWIFVFLLLLTHTLWGYQKDTKNWYDDFVFSDPCLRFQIVRLLGSAPTGGCDIGESIQTAKKIKEGDDISWYNQWKETADRIYALAKRWEAEGHTTSAKEAYLRACNYYRCAGFFLHNPKGIPLSLKTWKKSRQSFIRAIKYIKGAEVIKIPYQKTFLPGYFFRCQNYKKAPLLIVQTGFDGTGEELYFSTVVYATKRGYNCLVFEGPGQGEVIREQHIPFRYDWEKVIKAVVDYAISRPDVDPSNIALMGISMGGYLAPRGVAFEHRIKACIANGGVYDLSLSAYSKMPKPLLELLKKDPEKFNQEILSAMKEDTELRWFMNNGMFTFGVKTPSELMLTMKKYNLRGVAEKIKCHMLVIQSQEDSLSQDAKVLYQHLRCPKTFILFTRKEAAQSHCQIGAWAISNEIIFNWLDTIMK